MKSRDTIFFIGLPLFLVFGALTVHIPKIMGWETKYFFSALEMLFFFIPLIIWLTIHEFTKGGGIRSVEG